MKDSADADILRCWSHIFLISCMGVLVCIKDVFYVFSCMGVLVFALKMFFQSLICWLISQESND